MDGRKEERRIEKVKEQKKVSKERQTKEKIKAEVKEKKRNWRKEVMRNMKRKDEGMKKGWIEELSNDGW